MTLAEKIEFCARKYDADIVAFGGTEKLRGTEAFEIFPEVKSVICLGFRVLRGSHLGIEEGSTFYQYTTNGVETIEETIMPQTLLRLSALLEDEGYMAYPQRSQPLVVRDENGVNPETDIHETYRGVSERMLDFGELAVRCGAGERGMNGAVLTDAFGPFVRWCCVLTDAELPETEGTEPHLCDRCGACIAACPGHAISPEGVRNDWQCAVYYRGANRSKNPFMPADAYSEFEDREAIMDGTAELTGEKAEKVIDSTVFYPPAKHGYSASMCGRACDTACYMALEKRGVLTKSFVRSYRTRPEWKLEKI